MAGDSKFPHRVTVGLDAEAYDWLKAEAEKIDRPIAWLIRHLVECRLLSSKETAA